MPKLKLFFGLILFPCLNLIGQVNFTSSNLPIMIIDTDNQAILDEPKINVHLGIIDNGSDATNHIDDDYNDYDGIIGIEKRGSSSQSFPKVGYGFETRDAAGENNNVQLLGLPKENDWVLHGPFSDKSLIRNALAYKMGELLMDYSPRTRFVELVLNGDYRGVYLLTEKIKRDNNRVDISTLNPDENEGDDLTGGYILKHDKFTASDTNYELAFSSAYPSPVEGARNSEFLYHYPGPEDISPEQKEYIQGFIYDLETALRSDDFMNPTEGYRKYIDVGSFFRFFFVNEISKNVDGFRLSTYMYKDKDSVNGQLKMGPIWDFNLGFGNADYCQGGTTSGWAMDFNTHCPGDSWTIPFWWERLMEDTTFQLELKADWKALRNGVLSDERINACIDSMALLLSDAQERNFQRWPVLDQYIWPNNFIGGSYGAEINYLKGWLTDRLIWLDREIDGLGQPTFNPGAYFEPIAYPNPFSEEVTFSYYIGEEDWVRVFIYNARGQLVAELQDIGPDLYVNHLKWNPDLAPGIYFYQVYLDDKKSTTGKVVKQ